MKFKIHRDRETGYKIKHIVMNVEDLVSLKLNPTYKIKNYKSIFKITDEKIATQKAKELFTEMLVMMAHDMIEKNYAIVFPFQDFGYMAVHDVSNVNDPNYRFQIETNGKHNGLKLCLKERLSKYNKKHYNARFVRPLRTKLLELTKAGHTY